MTYVTWYTNTHKVRTSIAANYRFNIQHQISIAFLLQGTTAGGSTTHLSLQFTNARRTHSVVLRPMHCREAHTVLRYRAASNLVLRLLWVGISNEAPTASIPLLPSTLALSPSKVNEISQSHKYNIADSSSPEDQSCRQMGWSMWFPCERNSQNSGGAHRQSIYSRFSPDYGRPSAVAIGETYVLSVLSFKSQEASR